MFTASSESLKTNNHKVRTTQSLRAPNPGGNVITSTPNKEIDKKVGFLEGDILSPILTPSSQDKHYHTPIKSNEGGIFSDTNNSTTVRTTSNAGSNLSRTLSSKQKKLAQKYDIDINQTEGKFSLIEERIRFFNNSAMDSNQSSISQNGTKKISAQNNTKTIVGSEGKRLMNDPQISDDVREGHRVKRLIDLFEQCSKLSDVKVSATNNQSMGKK